MDPLDSFVALQALLMEMLSDIMRTEHVLVQPL